MYDKEISHYNVIVYDYVSSEGKYRRFKTIKCDTEERAVEIAKDYTSDNTVKFKVEVEQVCKVIWWED